MLTLRDCDPGDEFPTRWETGAEQLKVMASHSGPTERPASDPSPLRVGASITDSQPH